MTTTKLIEEIHDVSDKIAHGFLDVAVHLSIAAVLIQDKATQYDYCVAVDGLLTSLGAPGDLGPQEALGDRPESTDDRPLYQRLHVDGSDDQLVEQTVQVGMDKLNTLVLVYAKAASDKLGNEAGYATYERVYNAVDDFGTALGRARATTTSSTPTCTATR